MALTTSATESSLEPLERKTEKVTTGSPLRRANERCSLASSLHRAEIRQADLAAAGQQDLGLGQLLDAACAGERADRLLLAADLAAAAAEIDVGRAHLAVDLGGGDAERQQPVGIEQDADLAVDAAVALDPADALEALQLALDHVVDVPGKLLQRHARRGRGEGEDRLALDVDALDDRLVDVARQVGADLVDRVLDVVEGAVLVHLEAELDQRLRLAVGHGRDDVLDAGDVGDGVLDLLGDLGLELGRRRARLDDGDRDERNVDVRETASPAAS